MRTATELGLGHDELAIAFAGSQALRAEELGRFLQRAGAVTRRNGVELVVVAFQPGSFLVRCRAVARRVARNAKKEAINNPIRTVLATAGVAIAATSLAHAMSASNEKITPTGSEAARIIDEHNVQNISLITIDDTIVLMSQQDARVIRTREKLESRQRPKTDLEQLSEAVRDEVEGQIFDVGGVLHFRPDGYQFTVPIGLTPDYVGPRIVALSRYRVRGTLQSWRGRPELMEIAQATKVP